MFFNAPPCPSVIDSACFQNNKISLHLVKIYTTTADDDKRAPKTQERQVSASRNQGVSPLILSERTSVSMKVKIT
jgi:hypothetical protein